MAETKKEILSKLYFLRAMMSKISMLSEKCEEIEENIEGVENQKFVSSIKENNNLNEYVGGQEKIKSDINDWKEKESAANAEIQKLENDFDKSNKPYSVKEAIIPCIILNVIIATILFFLIKWWVDFGFSFWVGLITVPVSIVGIFFFVAMISVSTPSYHKKNLEDILKKIENKRQESFKIKVEIEKLQKKSAELETCIRDEEQKKIVNAELVKKEYAEFCEAIKSRKKELFKSHEMYSVEAKEVYNYIKRVSIIDERDWTNLDIIIYEIETGRADTLKEALHQMDLYIRHNEIIDAIEIAGKAISASITQNISDLKHSIGLQVTALRADLNELNESQKAIEGKLGDMLDAQELSNALLEKANESSEELAENIEYIKDIKYREYYGIEHL